MCNNLYVVGEGLSQLCEDGTWRNSSSIEQLNKKCGDKLRANLPKF